MCISAEALAVFLNMLSASIITTEPGRVIIAATSGEVHWVAHEDQWCTMGPEFEKRQRQGL
ncbi:hypothetical protein ACN2XU_06740 [Primorskyibacter sp. 2E107]|uniref:hypothetical protein n=1 Tax=Primorskyibacter sp. 2E107 TaxID=3403458 RepID=UPI003AF7A0BE